MVKVLAGVLIAIVSSVNAWCDDFQPSVLDIEIDEYVQAEINTSQFFEIQINVQVSGAPATAWMVVTNLDDGDMIGTFQNGNLGWHYVNRIDTTLYVSPPYNLDVGEQTIPWDGRGNDGEYLPIYYTPGQTCGNANPYGYYVWGYASESQRIPACDFVRVSNGMASKHVSIITDDENGNPLANPLFFGSYSGTVDIDGVGHFDNNSFFKWTIGEDPADISELRTTLISPKWKSRAYCVISAGGLNYQDQDRFFVSVYDTTTYASSIEKWIFVTEGEAVRDEDWGGWDNIGFMISENADGSINYPRLIAGQDKIWVYGVEIGDKPHMSCLTYDGEELFKTDIPDRGGSTGISDGNYMQHVTFGEDQDELLVTNTTSCLIQMIDGNSLVENGGYIDKEDIVLWENGNGDFFLDMNFADDAVPAWGCISGDPSTSYIKTSTSVDKFGFSVIWTDYRGLVSFGVLSTDGFGVGYGTYADEIIPGEGGSRWGGQLIDTGSNFDGMYIVNTEPKNGILGTSFVGFDSDMGYIQYHLYGDPTGIEEDTPQQIALNQNIPNPFNPSTAISFALPEDGHVLLTVYNIAGQQVATVHDGELSAGEHSVRWDADGFPAGVYFYTLACGEFSRTMKMTLVK